MEEKALHERKQQVRDRLNREVPGLVDYLARRYGKDAVVAAVLDLLGLGDRSLTERLAEVAFGLVPGQVQKVYETPNQNIRVLRIPVKQEWPAGGPEHREVEIQEWRGRALFGFDEETGTLAVGRLDL